VVKKPIFSIPDHSNTREWLKQVNENYKKLLEMDIQAANAGNLEGRFVDHPIADGKALYFITKENKKTVTIEHLELGGDDYYLPAWGAKATIPKEFALDNVKARDFWRNFLKE